MERDITSRVSRTFSSSPTILVSLLIILISLVPKCEAQSSTFFVTFTPIIIVAVILFCFCCCVCCACICHAKQRATNSSKHPRSTEISYSTNAPYEGAEYPQSHALQSYVPPSARVLYSAPEVNEQNSGSPRANGHDHDDVSSEPVPLPEATLHQGDAPPGYEEAIRMTAENVIDEPQQ